MKNLEDKWKSQSSERTTTLIVINEYDFEVMTSPNQNGTYKRYVDLVIKDFFIHSMNDRLGAEILEGPEDLQELQKDPEIVTLHAYINHQQLQSKAVRMNL